MPTPRQGYVWSGSEWTPLGPTVNIAPTYVQSSAPSSPTTGEIWVDTSLAIPTIDSATLVTTNTTQTITGNKTFAANDTSGYYYLQLGKSATASNNWHIGSEGDGNFRLYNGNLGAGTERWRLTSSGTMMTPGQPGFNAGFSSSTNTNTVGYIVLNDVSGTFCRFNNGGHYSTVNGRFTAPVAGYYYFGWSAYSYGTNKVDFYLTKNGGAVLGNQQNNVTSAWADYETSANSMVIIMSANDYVNLYLAGGYAHFNSSLSGFWGFLLG